ncbi:MAG TPA: hypothetical protein VNE19_06905 [Methylomirabilota bacterium]|jgi:hypothetical protein|nr:hypothetical protein [Methylomirabilota bacterium]
MRTAAVLLVVALAACSSATTAPQQAVAPEPTVADTTTPSARSTVPAATVPAFMTVTGIVTWNHQPQQGVAVEVSELGAPGRGPGLGSAKTAADGSFSVRFAPGRARPSVGAFVPAHDGFGEIGHPATMKTADALEAGTIEIRRFITGLSVHNGDEYKPGPLTLTWDPLPGATAYCVKVWRVELGAAGGSCPAFVHASGDVVTTTRYTTAPLDPAMYGVWVYAYTDTVIGELDLGRPGIAFTVK